MKAVVRIASPSEGTPGAVMDRLSDEASGTADFGLLFGGEDEDYALVSIPGGEVSVASTANLVASSYDWGTTTFTWVDVTFKCDYISVTTDPAVGEDGVVEINANGTDTVVFNVQKKAGSDDTSMTDSGDDEALYVKCNQLINITSIYPSLTNGVVSVTLTAGTNKGLVTLGFHGNAGEFVPVEITVRMK